MTSLPSEVLDLVHFSPMEDLILALLRLKFTTVPVQSLIASDQTFPVILIRRGEDFQYDGDSFVTSGTLRVNTFAEGLNADDDAALLGEAARVALQQSLNIVIPDKGHLSKFRVISMPVRRPDWATSTGPVQYADLPTGVVRYEATYEVAFRRPI